MFTPTLAELQLQNNALSGTLPALAPNSNLSVIILDNQTSGGHAGLTGVIPPSWTSAQRLTFMSANQNRLNGTLPPDAFDRADVLVVLRASGNALSGALPPSLGTHRTLRDVDLSRNAFVGTVPSGVLTDPARREISLSHNALSDASFPLVLGRTLRYLDVSYNAITASLDPAMSAPSLVVLLLNDNQLRGVLPGFLNLNAVRVLSLANNNLRGAIPDVLQKLPIYAAAPLSNTGVNGAVSLGHTFDVSNNALGGTIPNWLALYRFSAWIRTRIDGNPFECPVTDAVAFLKPDCVYPSPPPPPPDAAAVAASASSRWNLSDARALTTSQYAGKNKLPSTGDGAGLERGGVSDSAIVATVVFGSATIIGAMSVAVTWMWRSRWDTTTQRSTAEPRHEV